MELRSFKELLLKKAANDPALQTIINIIKDELIADKVVEALEKMARPQSSMGRSANAAITAFGNQMKNKDVEMFRDALAHHINHYRAALKNNKREVADQHLEKIIPMMHLAARAGAHSNGQLGLDYVPMEPWETNYTTPKRNTDTTGKLKEGTKGLRRRLNSTARPSPEEIAAAGAGADDLKGIRSVPDYRYLEMAPHEEHADTKKSQHKGGYPFEEIQLGNPAKIDAKEAYLHLHDVEPQDKFTPHPFDAHPIHDVAEHKQDSITPEQMESFASKMQDWHGSEHNAKWMEGVKQAHSQDPEAFKSRGKTKPGHHFDGLNLLPQPHSQIPKVNKDAPTSTATTPVITNKEATPKITKEIMSALPAELQAKFGGKKNV